MLIPKESGTLRKERSLPGSWPVLVMLIPKEGATEMKGRLLPTWRVGHTDAQRGPHGEERKIVANVTCWSYWCLKRAPQRGKEDCCQRDVLVILMPKEGATERKGRLLPGLLPTWRVGHTQFHRRGAAAVGFGPQGGTACPFVNYAKSGGTRRLWSTDEWQELVLPSVLMDLGQESVDVKLRSSVAWW